ncbi:MAG: hypothetical protein JEZ03_08605 [Bacteroidales bacterium]|nr:hypothetical protein [Bacteroidales bacterium]
MKKIVLTALSLCASTLMVTAQNQDKGKIDVVEGGKGYYYETILKDVNAVNETLEKEEAFKRFVMDQSGMKLPNKVDLYTQAWAQKVESQGNAGSCWCFSTLSFYETEVYRQHGKQVEISEIFTVYWEYVEKARRFVQERGNSLFEQGSEGNAVARTLKLHGAAPKSEYSGLLFGRKFHTHEAMYKEMMAYLNSVKASNAWNEEEVLGTIKAIMNHYIGVPPTSFIVEGKEYTPHSYLNDYLQINPDDFVEILSYKQEPYWEQVEYKVPDNWWHNAEYYNVPLDVFMEVIKESVRQGFTMSIGGDVSEAGFLKETQCAVVPDFDIPSAYINEDARQFRFSNETTTDDHGMQLVGYVENYNGDGKDWYLIKDSSSGSRNNDPNAPEFGYYFFHEDYVKLKMMGFTIHKDAVKTVLKKFKK